MKAIIAMIVAGLLIGGALQYREHVYNAGVADEAERRDAYDLEINRQVEQERAAKNATIADLNAKLTAAAAKIDKIKEENDHEKAASSQRVADLLAGRARDRVRVRAPSCPATAPAQDGKTVRASAADLDPDAEIDADLDPRVAGWLEGIRSTRNEAIRRLDGCIAQYDAVKAAADAMP